MAGLVPAIYVFLYLGEEDVDARPRLPKAGQDDRGSRQRMFKQVLDVALTEFDRAIHAAMRPRKTGGRKQFGVTR